MCLALCTYLCIHPCIFLAAYVRRFFSFSAHHTPSSRSSIPTFLVSMYALRSSLYVHVLLSMYIAIFLGMYLRRYPRRMTCLAIHLSMYLSVYVRRTSFVLCLYLPLSFLYESLFHRIQPSSFSCMMWIILTIFVHATCVIVSAV
jgi:hypothetical protein